MLKESLLKSKLLKMNLQTFAEGGEDNPDGANPNESNPDEGLDPEVQKKIEAESDRKLALARKKWEADKQKEIDDAIKAAKEQAESYASLTEKQKLEKQAEEERKAFLKEKAEFQKEKLTNDIKTDLIEKKLPVDFAPVLALVEDKEEISKLVSSIEKQWNEALSQQVKESLRQKTPPAGAKSKSDTVNRLAKAKNEKLKEKTEGPNPWA